MAENGDFNNKTFISLILVFLNIYPLKIESLFWPAIIIRVNPIFRFHNQD
jgi:hypothetical protein